MLIGEVGSRNKKRGAFLLYFVCNITNIERHTKMEYTQPMMTMPVTTAGARDDYANGWMNNPFAYLIWIYALRNFGFGNGYGNDGVGADRAGQVLNASQVDAIRETVGRILSDVQCGNANGMRFLEQIANEARANGVAITNVNGTICDAKTAVLSQLTNMQWQSSREIASVVEAINSCCCTTQNKIDGLACGIEKEILKQTNELQRQIDYNRDSAERGFASIANGISSLGFQLQTQDCGLKQLIQAEGSATRQLMRDLHTEDIITQKNTQIADLQSQIFRYSQHAQTAEIIAALKPTTTTTTT